MKENKNVVEQDVDDIKPIKNTIEESANNAQQLMPVKKNNGLIAILIMIIILLAGGLVYVLFFNNNNDGNNVTEIKDKDLTIYKSIEDDSLVFYDEDLDWIAPAFTIKVASDKAKVLAFDENQSSFVLYEDNGLYLYSVKAKSIQKLNLESNYKEYGIYLSEDESKIIGIGYLRSDGYLGYYNVIDDKKLYDGKYKSNDYALDYQIYQLNDNYVVFEVIDDTMYLLNSKKEEVKLTSNIEGELNMGNYRSYSSNGKYIYTRGNCITETCYITKIYNDSFKKIYEGEIVEESYFSSFFSFYNGNIYFKEGNSVKKIDLNGNVISNTKINGEINMIENNYVVYTQHSNIIYIANIDDSKEVKEVVKLAKSWSYNEFDSGYYTREVLDSLNEKDKKEGIYIIVEYMDKDSSGNYGMEYCYTPNKELIKYPLKNPKTSSGRAKPVLYLYPTKETNVTVTFTHPEYLTTTYPKYINSWSVTVKPNGDMYDKDGKYYYALYWDEKRYSETNFNEGFYVEANDAISFLEEKLAVIGLNDRERNEFIMYWLPIMEANGKNLVYFELTKERELNNKLIINPKPDSLLRVSIHIKKVSEKTKIKEQKLETFNRVGFTAVEWGGMTY